MDEDFRGIAGSAFAAVVLSLVVAVTARFAMFLDEAPRQDEFFPAETCAVTSMTIRYLSDSRADVQDAYIRCSGSMDEIHWISNYVINGEHVRPQVVHMLMSTQNPTVRCVAHITRIKDVGLSYSGRACVVIKI